MSKHQNQPRGPIYERTCAVCGQQLTPSVSQAGMPWPLVAHEFYCFKARPQAVPDWQRPLFERELLHERRSIAAKRGAAKRKK